MELGTLKTFWNRRNDGAWQIVGIKGIYFKSSTQPLPDHFEIEDDVVLVQPNIIGTIQSVLGESIVPIVVAVNGESVLRCVGTGFFVSCTGLLITAAHVITDPIERKYGGPIAFDPPNLSMSQATFGVLIPNNPAFRGRSYQFCPIEWSTFLAEQREEPLFKLGLDLRLNSDIAVCKVSARSDGLPHQPLTIIQSGIQGVGIGIDSNISAVGYTNMTENISFDTSGQIMGDNKLRLHVSTGAILERYPDNMLTRAVSTPGPCFSFSARIPDGMSGGPIFDREGCYVHGVISKGLNDESGVTKLSFGSMLAPSMTLPIEQMNGATLKTLQEGHTEGFAIMRGPGF